WPVRTITQSYATCLTMTAQQTRRCSPVNAQPRSWVGRAGRPNCTLHDETTSGALGFAAAATAVMTPPTIATNGLPRRTNQFPRSNSRTRLASIFIQRNYHLPHHVDCCACDARPVLTNVRRPLDRGACAPLKRLGHHQLGPRTPVWPATTPLAG